MLPPSKDPVPQKAVCSVCLGAQDIEAAVVAAACEGRRMSTVYASDDLAFPGIGLPKLNTHCSRCERTTVPIAVPADVAADLARRVR